MLSLPTTWVQEDGLTNYSVLTIVCIYQREDQLGR